VDDIQEDPVPAVLPYMITGVRLSIGVAWLVIVAAEMLQAASASGFGCGTNGTTSTSSTSSSRFSRSHRRLALEQAMIVLARRFSYE